MERRKYKKKYKKIKKCNNVLFQQKGKKMVFLLEKEILEPVTNKKKIVQSVGEGKRVSPLISL